MNDENEIAGSAIAAFTLSQFVLHAMLKRGVIGQIEAEQMLQAMIEGNQGGGPRNQKAAEKLSVVLQLIQSSTAEKH